MGFNAVRLSVEQLQYHNQERFKSNPNQIVSIKENLLNSVQKRTDDTFFFKASFELCDKALQPLQNPSINLTYNELKDKFISYHKDLKNFSKLCLLIALAATAATVGFYHLGFVMGYGLAKIGFVVSLYLTYDFGRYNIFNLQDLLVSRKVIKLFSEAEDKNVLHKKAVLKDVFEQAKPILGRVFQDTLENLITLNMWNNISKFTAIVFLSDDKYHWEEINKPPLQRAPIAQAVPVLN